MMGTGILQGSVEVREARALPDDALAYGLEHLNARKPGSTTPVFTAKQRAAILEEAARRLRWGTMRENTRA
jgi:hypothetical protein